VAYDISEEGRTARKKSRNRSGTMKNLNPSIPTTPRGGKHTMHDDRMELYRLSARKVGYPATKDRIWDMFVSIAIRHYPELLKPHRSQIYFEQLKKEGLM